jgi:hypothetical protein
MKAGDNVAMAQSKKGEVKPNLSEKQISNQPAS